MNSQIPEIKFNKTTKRFPFVKVGLVLVILALLGVGAFLTYQRREVLAYAWMNPDKVSWMEAADQQVKADADQKLKESISRVFIKETQASQ